MTQPRKRLSVSALRDYNSCARKYYFKRVAKLPDPMSHHAPAGTIIHNSFYAAYAEPTMQPDINSDRMKTVWFVHDQFEPEMSLALFDMFWHRQRADQPFDQLIQYAQVGKLDITKLERYFNALSTEMPVLNDYPFRPGQLKALGKGQKLSQKELRKGWGEYFRAMLTGVTEKPLPHPVKEIEREIIWNQNGVEMIGYIDIVMEKSPGVEIGIDLKTGATKPSEKWLAIEDQMLSYYTASELTNPDVKMAEFYYWHLKSGEMYLVKDNKKAREFLKHAAVHVSNKIAAQDWSPRFDKENCSMCTYWSECVKQPLIGVGPFENEIPVTPVYAPVPVPTSVPEINQTPLVLF